MMHKLNFALLFILVSFVGFSQRGKDGDYTAAALNEQVNTYTELTADANVGATSITVSNNTMTGAHFSSALQAGDLVMIYQVQGISIDLNVYTVTGWNGTYTVQNSFFSNGNNPDFIEFGSVTNYKSTGLYELAEVQSVSGANTINLTCGLQHSYLTTDNNHPQVIRVPRFRNLTVPNNTSITPIAWDGTVGGVVAIEVEEDLSVTGSGRISADSLGFRGGLADGTNDAAPVAGSINNVGDRGFLGSFSNAEGAEKGEGIYGGFIDHDIVYSKYCYGSIANGGGGANYHNAGGSTLR